MEDLDVFDLTTADIDECELEDRGNCDVNGFCSNTEGSYLCFCSNAYTGDGFTCDGMFIIVNLNIYWLQMMAVYESNVCLHLQTLMSVLMTHLTTAV